MKTLLSILLLAVSATALADDAIHVEKATGDNAYTVQEIVTKRAELKDKTVLVRGQVVKFNAQIMGKNWIHLQDGTGSDTDESNDLLVTSQEAAKVGDVITAQGVVRVEQDFGSGYAYSVMLEGATLQK